MVQNKWKHIEISCNLQTTISFDWNEIFSICKKLKSSDFYGEYFRKTFSTFPTLLGCQVSPKGKKSGIFDQKFYFGLRFFQIGDFSDYMEYGKIRPKGCLNICKGSHYWTNFLLLLVLKDGVGKRLARD